MIFRQEDGHQGDYEIPARFAFGDARVTYELVGRIEYEAEFEHFTSHFRHSSSNTLFHYDDLQKMVLVDPSKTIEDLCGRVSMQCSPSKAINSYVYHLINAETLQGSFFDLACQHLRTSFHTQVGPRTITGEYELGVHLEGWRQIDSAKLRSRYRTWDFALMNHGDEGSSKPAISTAPNSQAMDHTRNGAGRDQGLSLVLDIKMNELPPLSQVSPRASRQGETQKRSVPIGKPSANQTSPTVDGTSLEAHLLSMIRGPAPSTPDKQGAMDHTRNGAGCDRGLSPALDIKMNEPSPLLQVSPRVSRPLQPDRKKVLILNCRCGRKGDYIPASDFGTFQCTNCSKCTHIACMPKGGGYLTLGHHLFHRRAARGFECHDCDPPGLDSLRLKDRVPSIISRKNKMATQPGIAFLAKHGNYHYPVILLSAMDPADVESDYWVSWWRGNRYCTSPAPLPVSLVPFKSLQDLCIGNHVRRRKVRFGCWEFASKFRITDSDIVIDQDTAHFTGYNSQATEEVDRILSPHHSALEEMMKQGPNHEHTAECTSVLCRRQVDLLKTTSKKALRSDFNTAWAVTTSGFIHHTTLTEADVGAITVWMMQKSFDSFDNNHCSAEDHRRRLRWSLSPGTAHAWALVVASRRKEGWEEKEGRSLAQKELEDRAFDELISVEPKGDHSPTVDTHREAMEVLEYLLFHQNPAWKQGCLNVWGFNSGPHQDDWDPQETYKQSYDPDPMPSDVEEAIVEAAVSRVNSFFERTYSSGT
ncbi:hypothetical protein M408DRAFT_328373 [Serendipita vermifera MAFF 305830]|uniref:Zinc finger PHD-type domain-containing protein n=1 Tax=Serendipita vermifera MAFF 305830 TaxID=933852 RepID=A0A0C2XLL6_SERVB|nr:hypothetical protein M408DRAFT_328373 [Serendipita vermifera MAFF 305830]